MVDRIDNSFLLTYWKDDNWYGLVGDNEYRCRAMQSAKELTLILMETRLCDRTSPCATVHNANKDPCLSYISIVMT